MTDELFEVEARPDAAEGGETIVLRLHVQPGAGRAAVVGRRRDALHVRVAPPPADGRANEAALALVSDLLDVPVSRVELAGGPKSREKRVRVAGVEPDAVRVALDAAIERAAAGGRGPARGGRGAH